METEQALADARGQLAAAEQHATAARESQALRETELAAAGAREAALVQEKVTLVHEAKGREAALCAERDATGAQAHAALADARAQLAAAQQLGASANEESAEALADARGQLAAAEGREAALVQDHATLVQEQVAERDAAGVEVEGVRAELEAALRAAGKKVNLRILVHLVIYDSE